MNKPKLWLPIPKWVWLIFIIMNVCMSVGSVAIGLWDLFTLNALSAIACGAGYYFTPDPE